MWQRDFERICLQLGVAPERPKQRRKTRVSDHWQFPPVAGAAPASSGRSMPHVASAVPGIPDRMRELPLVPSLDVTLRPEDFNRLGCADLLSLSSLPVTVSDEDDVTESEGATTPCGATPPAFPVEVPLPSKSTHERASETRTPR